MKNLKIGAKLLLGFGVVLLVFVVAVLMVWRYVKAADDGNSFMLAGPVPAMELSSKLNEDAYELFLAARNVQFKEDPQSIKEYQDLLPPYNEGESKLQDMYKANPALKGPAHVADVVVPLARQYNGIMDRTITMVPQKQAAFNVNRESGQAVADQATALLTALFTQAKTPPNTTAAAPVSFAPNLDAIQSVSNILGEILTLRLNTLNSMISGDTAGLQRSIEILQAMSATVNTLTLSGADNMRALNLLRDSISKYSTDLNEFITVYTALDQLYQERAPVMDSLNKEISAAYMIAATRLREVAVESSASLKLSVRMLFIATAVAVLLGLCVAFLIARGISKPMRTIVTLAKRAGEGDLTVERGEFAYNGRDEMGTLVNAISSMIDTQARTLQGVVSVAESLTDGASNLSAISEETNAAMEEVKASIDQVAALSESNGAALEESNSGVDEMSSGADSVAQSATESAHFIAQTTDVSNKAIRTVNGVIEGMRNVDKKAKESEAQTRQLVSSVENVSSFVSVITGIADQTNLLALNAAIEAARAGEVGRGFAVVAEEVRKLAEESARAAQNVNGIIVELQKGAQDSIKVATESGSVLAETMLQAEQAQKELDEALKEMNHANDSIQNIAAVAEEQAASSKEVATAIDNATKSTMEMISTISNIRRSADETAEAAQGTAEQSEVLNGHVRVLTETLSHFKLPPSSAPAPHAGAKSSQPKAALKSKN